MPVMANITVKAADGTTDVVYVAKSPSAGDTVPAVWRNESVGTSPSHMPELRLSWREAPGGQKRRGRATYVYPQIATDTTTSLTSVVDKATAGVDFELPKGFPITSAGEFAAQFGNLFASALVKACNADGFSAQ